MNANGVDRYGFYYSDIRALKSSEHRIPIWVENNRTKKWLSMTGPQLEQWDSLVHRRPSKLKSRIRKGIPDALRGMLWCKIVKSDVLLLENPGVYEKYLQCKDKPDGDAIGRDVGRTFPKHEMFDGTNGQSALLSVLEAYSIHDPKVGYCQGMAFIAATFLSYMPQEQAFWHFVQVMQNEKHYISNVFMPGMPKVATLMHVFEKLLLKFLPDVSKHFTKEGLHCSMYASQWFITIYSYSFPFDLVTRVWDIFLHEGWKIVYRIAIALLKLTKKQLLLLNFERSMEFFRNLPTQIDTDKIIQTALNVQVTNCQIDQLSQE